MQNKIHILTVASDTSGAGLDNLLMSCNRANIDINVILCDWKGFSTKLIEVYNYLLKNKDIERFIFVDAYDVILLGSYEEINSKILCPEKMLVSTEKMCWPNSSLASQYPETTSEWKYINSGTYYTPREVYMRMIENNPPQYTDDDQLYITNEFLNNHNDFVLDYDCEVFQCHSFVAEDDYEYKEGRVFNLKTGSIPCIIHFNGRTSNEKVLKLL